LCSDADSRRRDISFAVFFYKSADLRNLLRGQDFFFPYISIVDLGENR